MKHLPISSGCLSCPLESYTERERGNDGLRVRQGACRLTRIGVPRPVANAMQPATTTMFSSGMVIIRRCGASRTESARHQYSTRAKDAKRYSRLFTVELQLSNGERKGCRSSGEQEMENEKAVVRNLLSNIDLIKSESSHGFYDVLVTNEINGA